jgi:hypothetical protein
MPSFSTAVAYIGGARHTVLHRCIVAIPWTCHLIAILLLRALITILLRALIAILLLVRGTLLIQITIPLTRWSLVPRLIALLKASALTSITSRGLSLKPLPFSIHLLVLIVNHNSTNHERLEVGVRVGHQLELETIIQTLQKKTLLISIISHLIQSITWQLSKFVMILRHRHRSLLQRSKFLRLQLY